MRILAIFCILTCSAGALRAEDSGCTASHSEIEILGRIQIESALWQPTLTFARNAAGGYRVRWVRVGKSMFVSNNRERPADLDFSGLVFPPYELNPSLAHGFKILPPMHVNTGDDTLMTYAHWLARERGTEVSGPCFAVIPAEVVGANQPLARRLAENAVVGLRPLLADELQKSFPTGTNCHGELLWPWSLETRVPGRVSCRATHGQTEFYFWAWISADSHVESVGVGYDPPSDSLGQSVYSQLSLRPHLNFNLDVPKHASGAAIGPIAPGASSPKKP